MSAGRCFKLNPLYDEHQAYKRALGMDLSKPSPEPSLEGLTMDEIERHKLVPVMLRYDEIKNGAPHDGGANEAKYWRDEFATRLHLIQLERQAEAEVVKDGEAIKQDSEFSSLRG